MGEHVHALAFFSRGNFLNDFKAMPADGLVDRHILVGNLACAAQRGVRPFRARAVAHGSQHLVEGPREIDRGRPRCDERGAGTLQRFIGGVSTHSEPDPIGRSGSDQRCAADLHGPDRAGGIVDRDKPFCDEAMRQLGLIDNADARAVALDPNAAHLPAVDFHG